MMMEWSFLAFSRMALSHRAFAAMELFKEAAVGRNNRLEEDIFVSESYL